MKKLVAGYAMAPFPRAKIFFGRTGQLLSDYREILPRPVRLIACKNWGDCERGLPWLPVDSLGGVRFLRHEISHALPNQNATLLKAYRIGRSSPWLTEGLAVSFGRQRDYFSRGHSLEIAASIELAGLPSPCWRFKYSIESRNDVRAGAWPPAE